MDDLTHGRVNSDGDFVVGPGCKIIPEVLSEV